ncbi:helix-turn-helix domain-containing protein [Streptomyces sp. SID6139]|uniref:helix-turn-helix domain-containing protein n=1 Tax=Streptomyces sp. SID6139 TaxID=2690320 RepID=UPI00387EE873
MNNTCHVCAEHTPGEEICCENCKARLSIVLQQLPNLYVRLYLESLQRGPRVMQLSNFRKWKYRTRSVTPGFGALERANHCVQTVYDWALWAVPSAVPPGPVRQGFLLQNLCAALHGDINEAVKTAEAARRAAKVYETFTACMAWLDDTRGPSENSPKSGNRLLTAKESAQLLGVTPSCIRKWIARGYLRPAAHFGRTRTQLFREDQVVATARARSRSAKPNERTSGPNGPNLTTSDDEES